MASTVFSSRLSRTLGLALICGCFALGNEGCSRDYGRSVHTRLTDVIYADKAARPLSTAHYPREGLSDDYRVVLVPTETTHSASAAPLAPDTTRITIGVTVPSGAELEFEYGAEQLGAEAAKAFFVLTLLSPDGSARELLNRTVDVPATDTGAGTTGWLSGRADLSGVSGAAELIFETRTSGGAARAFFAEPVITVAAAEQPPPNIVLISLDTLRADHLGINGYGRETSPKLDALFSKQGLVVDHAYSSGADTILGHTAMLTGMSPTAALVGSPRFIQTDALVTLAEALRARGYRTAAMTENATLMPRMGFPRGFDAYRETKGRERAASTGGQITQTFSRGLQWLRERPPGPFFLFLHTYEVHFPYEPPEAYAGLFPTPQGAPKVEQQRDAYDREIRYTDDRTAALLADIDTISPARDTVLVITSDHGEEFGEHGRQGHGTQLHNEIVGVPMLIRAPGRLPSGQRRSGPMGLVDLMPTLLELVGAEIPDSVMGRSLLAHLRDNQAITPVPIFHEGHTPWAVTADFQRDPTWLPPTFAVTQYPFRMIRVRTEKAFRYELYDLENDPHETSNIYIQGAPGKPEALRIAVDRYFAESEAYQAALVKDARTRATQKAYPLAEEPDAERLEKLKALGYVNP